jgi:RNA polymerase sigma-70 factor (ECF subfamily)
MSEAGTPDHEQTLITAAQRGDRRAFGELVRLHRQGAVNVVYRLYGDPDLAEEAAQEAFLRAWQKLLSYRPEHQFRSWVYRIAINTAIDALRKRRDAANIEDLPLDSGAPGPEDTLVAAERTSLVQAAVLKLPEASRAVLVLREYEEMSYAEIAAALEIPVGTVMSRLNYARGQLRKALAEVMEA